MDIIILFFLLGVFSGVFKSNLKLPPAIYELLSVLLLVTIGLKGGIELNKEPFFSLLPQIVAVLLIGFFTPFILFPLLLKIGKFSKPDSASIAAHYGSVSVGTFAVVLSYLEARNVSYEEYVSLFVVILEIPAIISGILLAKKTTQNTKWKKMFHEIFFGKSIVLLVGGMCIAWIAGPEDIAPIKPLFFGLFKGVLALFLLEMGIVVAGKLSTLKRHGAFLVLFGLIVPVMFSFAGIAAGFYTGLSVGGMTILGTLTASASYIAVPAAMRISVPESNPTLSLSASLGVTFPFNVLVGIPLYHFFASQFEILMR